MTISLSAADQVVAFMREGSRTGKLAVTRKDGSPHVVPIWFDFDDDTGELVFVMGKESLSVSPVIATHRDKAKPACCPTRMREMATQDLRLV